MYLSRYTLLLPAPTDNQFLLVNYLSGNIDQMDATEYQLLVQTIKRQDWHDYPQSQYFLKRGYLFTTPEQEQQAIQDSYIQFQMDNDLDQIQIIFVPTYSCNFACSYCFQQEYGTTQQFVTLPVIDRFFAFIASMFAQEEQKPYLTLFGGEPLLSGQKYQQTIDYFMKLAAEKGYSLAIVSNGYTLLDYLPIIQQSKVDVKEIQVTVDGDSPMHNQRRKTKGGQQTFDQITAGIDQALKLGYRINMRIILDKSNINSLVPLAQYCQQRGWLDFGPMFQTSFGRNYELYTCQKSVDLFSRLEMWQQYLKLAKENPILRNFHKPYLYGMKTVHESGLLPQPSFDTCPAAKKEWAFDLHGDIYGCTASVGVERFRLGNFLESTGHVSELSNQEQLLQWQTRDVLAIEKCRSCELALVCGGGCGVLACNQHGTIQSPDCRPVKEILELGLDYYQLVK